MMDNGQPDSKRPRTVGPVPGPVPGPPAWNNPQRELPQPQPTSSAPPYSHHGYARQPEPQPNPLDVHRRHSAHTEHQQYDPDQRRPNSGPSPHVFHHPGTQPPPQLPYGGRQTDAMLKREPGEDVAPINYRPASTGSAPDHVAPTHEGRYQQQHLPPFDLPRHSGPQPYQPGLPYAPPQSPMPANEPYGHTSYSTPGLPQQPRQEYVTYPTPITNTQKRKAQRAAQACDSCRTLKAKCDEGRPDCTSCKEKGIQCVYRDPPPKQQDKSQAEIIEYLARIESSVTENIQGTFQSIHSSLQGSFKETIETAISNAMRDQNDGFSRNLENLSGRMGLVENALRLNALDADTPLKDEPEEVKTASPVQHLPAQAAVQIPVGPDPRHYQADESPFASNTSEQLVQERPQPPQERVQVAEEEEEAGEPVNPGQSSIPVNHTTGAARLLLVRPISELARGIIESDRIKNEKYPMLQEERRGLLRLYGRGEGTERLPGYDKDPLTDHGYDSANAHTPSDASSDVSSPPGEEWGQLGGLTPPGEPIARGLINGEGMPDLLPGTVLELVESYKEHINNMHPILVPRQLDALVKYFLRSIQEQQPKPKQVAQLVPTQSSGHVSAGFVMNRNPDSPGNKRKRSPGMADTYDPPLPTIPDHKPGHPVRSIGSAIILLVMALGRICQEKGKIPDCVPDGSDQSLGSSPTIRNGHPSSPLQSSPAMSTLSGLPSPIDGEKIQSRSRRASFEGNNQALITTGVKPRNLDAIPGLEYFGLATDIIGNQAGGNSLQHVHANILASLYHGQLGRPLESHSYLHQACRSLQVILRPKLDRFKRLNTDYAIPPAKDNPLVFAFWTCLQLESDIVAELPVPHSGILTYEEDMPGPNLQAAVDIDKFDSLVIESYAAQLHMRKHLNQLHNMFYKPVNDSEFPSVFNAKNIHHFPTIDLSLAHLEKLSRVAPNMQWEEDDLPASDILRARLRAKYYGAKVITYRHSLLKILEHSFAKNPPSSKRSRAENKTKTPEEWSEELKPGIEAHLSINKGATRKEDIDPRIHEYASNCIKALIKSTTAFHGLGDPGRRRLIVTNIWGTAHAQWGNLLTLQAAFVDPILGPLIDKKVLKDLYDKTMAFLRLTAQPSSALHIDYKILEHVAKEIDLIPKPVQAGASFSSGTSADVSMTGL